MGGKMDLPKISVIIPVYNTEKFLTKCIDSVLRQTYPNIEIVIVNDASPDGSEKIILDYQKKNSNIVYLKHEKNKGLFVARLTGIKACSGDYVAFLDSDDSISSDYYRKMLRTLESKNADICLADFVWEYEDGSMKYIPAQELRNVDIEFDNKQILDKYFKGHAYDFIWQVVWNKLIKRSVIEKALPYIEKFASTCDRLIMLEDVAYSSIFYMFANKVVNCHNVYYHYYTHSGQSINTNSKEKFIKNLTDTNKVLCYVKELLVSKSKFEDCEEEYIKFRDNILASYYIMSKGFINGEKLFIEITGLKDFDKKECCFVGREQALDFDKNAYNQYEKMVQAICSKKTKVVSFDIFDTLLLRSTLNPTDIFYLVGYKCKNDLSSSFACRYQDIRQNSEYFARVKSKNPEITFDEIFDYMEKDYHMSPQLTEKLKTTELEVEFNCSLPRKTGMDLYDIAMINSKKVVYTSDMYLSKQFIYSLLHKAGYSKENQLFVSNEYMKTKDVGKLFKEVASKLKVSTNAIVHIGDNIHADVKQAQGAGVNGFHLPNVSKLFVDRLFSKLFNSNITNIEINNNIYIGLRQMFATVANELFDFPFTGNESELNGSTKYLGYYAVGMELFAFINWIIQNTRKCGCLHFVSRDGYIPQLAFEIIKKSLLEIEKLPNSNYLFMSRKALYPLSISSPQDLFTSYAQLNIFNHSVEKLLNYFPDFCIKDDGVKKLTKEQKSHKFIDFNDLYKNIHLVADCLDFKMIEKYHSQNREYILSQIHKNDVLVDIGYNGRGEVILSSLLGFPIDSFYLHGNADTLYMNMDKVGAKNQCFFNYKPVVTGELRELFFMKTDQSFLGYDFNSDGKPTLRFDKQKEYKEYELSVINAIQYNELKFVRDLMENNKNNIEVLRMYPREVAALPLEKYLHSPEYIDVQIFKGFMFEDSIGMGNVDVIQSWEFQRTVNHMIGTVMSAPTTRMSRYRLLAEILLPSGTRRRKFANGCARVFIPRGSRRRAFVKKLLLKNKRK